MRLTRAIMQFTYIRIVYLANSEPLKLQNKEHLIHFKINSKNVLSTSVKTLV